MQTFDEWFADQRQGHPQCAPLDDLVEVKAKALYRVLYLGYFFLSCSVRVFRCSSTRSLTRP